MKSRPRLMYALLAITGFGILLRWLSPGRVALWRDEVQFLNIATLPDASAIVTYLTLHESHPPLLYLVAHMLGSATGDPAKAMHWPVLLASVAAIPAAYWVASIAHRPLAGVIAALLTSVSLPLSAFSVQIRPYAFISLALLVSTGAAIISAHDSRLRWKFLWMIATVFTLYTHHMGLLLLAGQLGVMVLLSIHARRIAVDSRQWIGWVGAALLVALPSLVLLTQQAGAAGHATPAASWSLEPFARLVSLIIAYPAELLLPLLCIASLIPLWLRNGQRNVAAIVPAGVLVATLLLLTAASYRAGLLTPFVVLSLAPLGAVASGGAMSMLLTARKRFATAVAIECAIVLVTASSIVHWGFVKTNVRAAAQFVASEYRASDLVIVATGALGPAFNRYFEGTVSQIDFPIAGPVARFPFDHHFDRVGDPAALRMVTDSIEAAVDADRRIWVLMPSDWISNHPAPVQLSRREHGGLGQVDAVRANLIRQIVTESYGAAARTFDEVPPGRSLESVSVEIFTSDRERCRARYYASAGFPC